MILILADNDVFFTSDTIGCIYDSTPDESPLRALAVDFVVQTLSNRDIVQLFERESHLQKPFCPSFTLIVMLKILGFEDRKDVGNDVWARRNWRKVNRCVYHVVEKAPKTIVKEAPKTISKEALRLLLGQ
jgi:hypothetical protein